MVNEACPLVDLRRVILEALLSCPMVAARLKDGAIVEVATSGNQTVIRDAEVPEAGSPRNV